MPIDTDHIIIDNEPIIIDTETPTVIYLDGIRGEKGEPGAMGPQGPQGETGAQGPQGLQGSNVETVANYTALRSLSNYENDLVIVADYNYTDLAGDTHTVVGGLFKKSTTTMSDDNGTVIISSNGVKWLRVFDTNNGINTDWFAIENHTTRFNHAANISLLYKTHQYISGKTYRFSNILSDDGNYILKPKTSIEGEFNTLLKYEGETQVALIFIKDLDNLEIKNIAIDLPNTNGNQCISLSNCDNIVIDHVNLIGSWWSVFVSLSNYCIFKDITAQSIGSAHNIELNESTYCIVENCDFKNSLGLVATPGNNIEIYSRLGVKANNNIIKNNVFKNSNSAVAVFGAENTIIDGNFIDNTRSNGIFITDWEFGANGVSKHTLIINNNITNVGGLDIQASGILTNGLYTIIQNNTISNCGLTNSGEAVLLSGDYSNAVQNTIHSNYGVGILVNGDYANIDGNILYNNSLNATDRNGITIESCTNAKVSNNVIFCTSTQTTFYGIFINSTASNTVARDNVSYNHASWNIYNSSTTSRITSQVVNSFGQLGGNNTIIAQFTATAGQTSFSTSSAGTNLYYMKPTSNPDIEVFVNGLLLQYTNGAVGAGQYTYNNNTVTTYALTVGDKVTIKFRR